MLEKSQRKIVYERAIPFAEKNYKKIEVKMGRYDGSQKCHHVARHLLEEEADTVAVTWSFVPNSGVNVHFINKINGEYIDHTLGYLSKRNTYYLVSEHTIDELKDTIMNNMLNKEKDEMMKNLFTDKELRELGIKLNNI